MFWYSVNFLCHTPQPDSLSQQRKKYTTYLKIYWETVQQMDNKLHCDEVAPACSYIKLATKSEF